MRIAVAYKDGEVCQHFGKAEEFKIYATKDDRVIASKVFPTEAKGHGALE